MQLSYVRLPSAGWLATVLLTLWACQAEPKRRNVPPVCGNFEVVARQVNGQTVLDTLYHTIPRFDLPNQRGQGVATASLAGKVLVVSFVEATPSAVNRLTQATLAQLQALVRGQSGVQLLSFVADSARLDRTAPWAARLRADPASWQLLRCNAPQFDSLTQDVYRRTDSTFAVNNDQLVLFDNRGRLRTYYPGTSKYTVVNLNNDIQALLRAN